MWCFILFCAVVSLLRDYQALNFLSATFYLNHVARKDEDLCSPYFLNTKLLRLPYLFTILFINVLPNQNKTLQRKLLVYSKGK